MLPAFLILLILVIVLALGAAALREAGRRGRKAREKEHILRRVADLESRRTSRG